MFGSEYLYFLLTDRLLDLVKDGEYEDKEDEDEEDEYEYDFLDFTILYYNIKQYYNIFSLKWRFAVVIIK